MSHPVLLRISWHTHLIEEMVSVQTSSGRRITYPIFIAHSLILSRANWSQDMGIGLTDCCHAKAGIPAVPERAGFLLSQEWPISGHLLV